MAVAKPSAEPGGVGGAGQRFQAVDQRVRVRPARIGAAADPPPARGARAAALGRPIGDDGGPPGGVRRGRPGCAARRLTGKPRSRTSEADERRARRPPRRPGRRNAHPADRRPAALRLRATTSREAPRRCRCRCRSGSLASRPGGDALAVGPAAGQRGGAAALGARVPGVGSLAVLAAVDPGRRGLRGRGAVRRARSGSSECSARPARSPGSTRTGSPSGCASCARTRPPGSARRSPGSSASPAHRRRRRCCCEDGALGRAVRRDADHPHPQARRSAGLDDHDLNEHLCLDAARRAGLIAARTRIARFDEETRRRRRRATTASSAGERIVRVHQEDLCQALGVPPGPQVPERGRTEPRRDRAAAARRDAARGGRGGGPPLRRRARLELADRRHRRAREELLAAARRRPGAARAALRRRLGAALRDRTSAGCGSR